MDAKRAPALVAWVSPVTKGGSGDPDPASTLRLLRRAIKIAATPPTGPVFLALPMDVLDAPAEEEVVPTSIPDTRVAPSAEAIRRAAELLAGAERPIAIIGDGISFAG